MPRLARSSWRTSDPVRTSSQRLRADSPITIWVAPLAWATRTSTFAMLCALLDQHPRAELLRQRQVLIEHGAVARHLARSHLDMHGDQLAAERASEHAGPADQQLRGRVIANADHHPNRAIPGQLARLGAVYVRLSFHTFDTYSDPTRTENQNQEPPMTSSFISSLAGWRAWRRAAARLPPPSRMSSHEEPYLRGKSILIITSKIAPG